jgi:demethylmenaquinone methyltransferase/2-methoxy-6-polyprenyl-1,4-benzoquinol methylase
VVITMLNVAETTNRDTYLRHAYDQEAGRYDQVRYKSAKGRLFTDLEVALLESWLPLGRGARVLDLPTGTGRLSVPLAMSGSTVVGGDLSFNMLRMAAAKTGDAAAVKFTQASGTQLPFADATFDAVISFKFFHLVPNDRKRAFIAEMARVLKPGRPLVIEFDSPFYGGVLALYRYYFNRRQPGKMRMKCLFPDQIPEFFDGLTVTRIRGVKLPFIEWLEPLIGRRAIRTLDSWFGRIPVLRYFSYALIVEARKQ